MLEICGRRGYAGVDEENPVEFRNQSHKILEIYRQADSCWIYFAIHSWNILPIFK